MKELKVRQAVGDGTALSRMYEIHYVGGGEIPISLKGYYTSYSSGDAAITKWKIANADKLEAKQDKENKMEEVGKLMSVFKKEETKKEATKQARRKATLAAKEA